MTQELVNKSISDLSQLLQTGEVSSVEITKAFLSNAESKKELNCFINLDPENALKQAEASDLKGYTNDLPLQGIPVAVKDNIVTRSYPTTAASRMLHGYQSPFDATVVQKLQESGALIFGKTNMDEFAMGSANENSWFGPVKNPWDHALVPGGSSGGSAACVAARCAPVALGSDTGGSIRQPASFCNLLGLKPTYGRVSRYGLIAFASSLDQIGVLAQSSRDCHFVIEAISGYDPLDSTSVANLPSIAPDHNRESLSGLKIGIPEEYFTEALQASTRQRVEESLAVIEKMGAELVPISLPHTEHALACYYILAPAEASSNLARFDGIRFGHSNRDGNTLEELYHNSRTEGFGKEVKRRILIGNYVLSSGYYDAFYRKAQKVRTLICDDFQKAFEKVDLIATPTTPATAFEIGKATKDPVEIYLEDIFTIPANLAGLPSLSLPCQIKDGKKPLGFQLMGKSWNESLLLEVASLYEKETKWNSISPDTVNQ